MMTETNILKQNQNGLWSMIDHDGKIIADNLSTEATMERLLNTDLLDGPWRVVDERGETCSYCPDGEEFPETPADGIDAITASGVVDVEDAVFGFRKMRNRHLN